MVQKGPYEAIVDMHMPTGNFILRIGSRGVNHTIIYRGVRTNLSALAPEAPSTVAAEPPCRLPEGERVREPRRFVGTPRQE